MPGSSEPLFFLCRLPDLLRRDYGTSSGSSEPLLFLYKSLHFGSYNGGGSKFQTPCREIAGPHLAAQNHCFSDANPYILALLMGVDLPDAMIKDSQWMSVALLCKPFV